MEGPFARKGNPQGAPLADTEVSDTTQVRTHLEEFVSIQPSIAGSPGGYSRAYTGGEGDRLTPMA